VTTSLFLLDSLTMIYAVVQLHLDEDGKVCMGKSVGRLVLG